MTVLSNRDILDLHGGSVIIDPFDERNVNTSSYDVTLGSNYYIEKRPPFWRRRSVYNIWNLADVRRVWEGPYKAMPLFWWRLHHKRLVKNLENGIDKLERMILLPPQCSILAHTEEFIGGRYDVTTRMQARSSYGRNFIEVCKCAGYGDVGYINRWTMEITNNSRFYRLPLVVGRRIAQISFMTVGSVDGNYSIKGKYQTSADLDTLKTSWEPSMMLPRLDLDRDNPDLCEHGFSDWNGDCH